MEDFAHAHVSPWWLAAATLVGLLGNRVIDWIVRYTTNASEIKLTQERQVVKEYQDLVDALNEEKESCTKRLDLIQSQLQSQINSQAETIARLDSDLQHYRMLVQLRH